MNVLVVEDESIIREGIARTVRRCLPKAVILTSENAKEAQKILSQIYCDVVFLDIEMAGMNGVSLARIIREEYPCINIIFTTAYSQHTDFAMEIHASGYIMKPVTEEKVRKELQDLRYLPGKRNVKAFIRTFGKFELFYDRKQIQFRYGKTKELLAYLVDSRGSTISSRELQTVLFGNSDQHISYYKQIRKDLLDTLREAGCESIVSSLRGSMCVIPGQVICDFYEFIEGNEKNMSTYYGEYMSQYAWASATREILDMQVRK